MADSTIHVSGLADIQRFLDTLPAKIERNILRGALRAGAKPIKDAAVAKCPVGPPSREGATLYGHYAGALRDSIRVSTRAKGGYATAVVSAGGKNKKTGADVFYAHIIEFTGARPHTITSKKGMLTFGGGFFKSVQHPGMKAKPFMRPALDEQAQNAVVAAAEYMKARLQSKHGLDTSDVIIEGGT